MWLLIDDCRNMGADVIARTAEAGKLMLKSHRWEAVVFDNDLGQGQEEGWRILEWALAEGFAPPQVQLVTSNPAAHCRMCQALSANGYTTKNHSIWNKE